jgi:N utilization substance protein B
VNRPPRRDSRKEIRKDGIDPVTRARARRRALQALYAWQMSGGEVGQVIAQFAHEQAHEIADLEYFDDLVRGVVTHRATLDEALAGYLDRTVEEVDPIERAVLRLAAYEMLHRIDVPYRVVLNEAIEIAKRFGSEHGHTFVNGVLDRAAAQWRAAEFSAAR